MLALHHRVLCISRDGVLNTGAWDESKDGHVRPDSPTV
jgi:hypothetical protein